MCSGMPQIFEKNFPLSIESSTDCLTANLHIPGDEALPWPGTRLFVEFW